MVDKEILQSLGRNCRESYQSIARRINLSANAVKRRVNRLIEVGTLDRFEVSLSLAMVEAETMLGLISTEEEVDYEFLINQIGNHNNITQVRMDSYGVAVIRAEYRGVSELMEIGSYLRGLKGVSEVLLHPEPRDTGGKMELGKVHLAILRELVDDPRMPVVEISKRTGIGRKRVKRLLDQIIESRAINFTVRQDLNSGDCTMFVIRTSWDERMITAEGVSGLVMEKYPVEYWESIISAAQPLMFIVLVTDHIRKSEEVYKFLKGVKHVEPENIIIPYPMKRYPGIRDIRLREMFREVGIDPPDFDQT